MWALIWASKRELTGYPIARTSSITLSGNAVDGEGPVAAQPANTGLLDTGLASFCFVHHSAMAALPQEMLGLLRLLQGRGLLLLLLLLLLQGRGLLLLLLLRLLQGRELLTTTGACSFCACSKTRGLLQLLLLRLLQGRELLLLLHAPSVSARSCLLCPRRFPLPQFLQHVCMHP